MTTVLYQSTPPPAAPSLQLLEGGIPADLNSLSETSPFAPVDLFVSAHALPRFPRILSDWMKCRWERYGTEIFEEAERVVGLIWDQNRFRFGALDQLTIQESFTENLIRNMEIVLVHGELNPRKILRHVAVLQGALELVRVHLAFLPAYQTEASSSPLLDSQKRPIHQLYEEAALTPAEAKTFANWIDRIEHRLAIPSSSGSLKKGSGSKQFVSVEPLHLKLRVQQAQLAQAKRILSQYNQLASQRAGLGRHEFVGPKSAYLQPSGVQVGRAKAGLGRLANMGLPQK